MISPDRLVLQQQVYNFLRTLTIKFDPFAQQINTNLISQGIAVADDPLTWKYYVNMSGNYHATDTAMVIQSLDTHQPILFSIANLALHPRTRVAYLIGGNYYTNLCKLYPEQVDLIKSILFPVTNIAAAIAAPDLTLLGYGTGYLEDTELSNFVERIEDFLTIVQERWYFNFLDDEPYFYVTFWGGLWVYLAMLIMSGRMENIRTPYVHSWDIWNELTANGLDNYSDILGRKKSMFLYENIDYLRANAGKQSNLDILADNLLSDLGVGLYGLTVVQESESGAANYQLTPQLVPVRLSSNSESLAAQIEIKSVGAIQSEIFSMGLTGSDSAETVNAVERKLGDTTLNEFNTKFLEVRPVSQNKPYAEILNTFLVETLIVSITQGYYTEPVEVFDPLTNDPIYLLPSELLALFNYATLQSMGLASPQFPTIARVYSAFLPTIGTPAKSIVIGNDTLTLSFYVDAQEYLSGLSYAQFIAKPVDFANNATDLWLRYISHHVADQTTVLTDLHDVYQYLSTLCHTRREIDLQLVQGYDNYDVWLGPAGINITDTIVNQYNIQSDPRIQWANLADAIISTLLPITPVLASFGNFTPSDSGYARLRDLFIQMCSYRVVFLEANRDTAEFAVGAKWSTLYNPIQMSTFEDYIVGINMATTSTTTLTDTMTLHSGFHENDTFASQTHAKYGVTTVAQVTANTMLTVQETPKAAATLKGSSVSTSVMKMPYHGSVPTMIPVA